MIDGFPLSFFLPLVVHALAGLTSGVTGAVAFSVLKRSGRHGWWGTGYLWAYTVVFLTATILSVQHWPADAYLFALATIGYGCALGGYWVRRSHQHPLLMRLFGQQWIVVYIIGMIGSYVILWTAFFVDNAHLIPGLKLLPTLVFWTLPTIIAPPFIALSLSRFAPKTANLAGEGRDRRQRCGNARNAHARRDEHGGKRRARQYDLHPGGADWLRAVLCAAAGSLAVRCDDGRRASQWPLA